MLHWLILCKNGVLRDNCNPKSEFGNEIDSIMNTRYKKSCKLQVAGLSENYLQIILAPVTCSLNEKNTYV